VSAVGIDVRNAVVRIGPYADGYDRSENLLWGSGFFIAPGWVLTSAHVVGYGRGAVWRGERAVGVTTAAGERAAGTLACALPAPADPDRPPATWASPDLALVKVPEATDAECLWLSDRSSTGRVDVGMYGYLQEPGGEQEFAEVPGTSGHTDGGTLMLECAFLPKGCSGGPVLDHGRGSVIGVTKGKAVSEPRFARVAFVTALRAFWDAGPAARAAWHEALCAHDRYHLDRYYGAGRSWPRVQADLQLLQPHAGSFTADQRAELYGRFAALPPPRSSGHVMGLVNDTLNELLKDCYRIDVHAPRSWRDGVGLLYAPSDGRPEDGGSRWELEREAVVLFAARTYASLRRAARTTVPSQRGPAEEGDPAPAAPAALQELRDWVTRSAVPLRNGHVRRRIAAVLEDTGPESAGTEETAGATPYADVVVEIDPDLYGSHAWRIKLVHADGQVTPVCNSEVGVQRPELEADIRAALAAALDRGDGGEHLAAVDFVLPREMFDEPVDTWRISLPAPDEPISAHSLPIGRRRTVAVRDRQRALQPVTPEWRRRWATVADGPLHAVPLCGDVRERGHGAAEQEHPEAAYGRLHECGQGAVPVHCARAGTGRAAAALAAAIAAGHPVALWRRCSHRHDDCEEFHARAGELLRTVGDGGRLREQVRALRNRNAVPGVVDPEWSWARELVLLADPPPSRGHPHAPLREPPLSP
jgi:hypothetical protein